MIQGICGRTFIGSSVPPGHLSSWESRLRQRLATVGSTESALIWRTKTTPAGQSISRLAVSTRHTNGTDSTGSPWSTPRASDGEKGGPNMSFGAGGQPLPAQMHQATWPTVLASDDKYRLQGDSQQSHGLSAALIKTWGTPAAHPPGGTPEQFLARKEKAKANGSSLGISLTDVGLQLIATAALGPTPNGSSATTAKRGAPNPAFAFWLMGFPDEWTSGALAAMQSFRSSRPKSSRRSSTPKSKKRLRFGPDGRMSFK